MPWMPGIPTEVVTAYPGSVHDGLTQRLELQLRWSRCGTTHSPRCHSPPLGTVGPVANFWGMPWILALGARRGPCRVRKGFPALELEKGGTAPLVRDGVHRVRRRSRRCHLFQIATAFVYSSRQSDARRRGILKLLGFLTGRLLAIVAPLFFLALVVGGSLATVHLFLWNVRPPDGSLSDA